jgi:hypothetical protein
LNNYRLSKFANTKHRTKLWHYNGDRPELKIRQTKEIKRKEKEIIIITRIGLSTIDAKLLLRHSTTQ